MTTSARKAASWGVSLLFAVTVVGVPYSYFISQACQPTGVSDFVEEARAFYTAEGC